MPRRNRTRGRNKRRNSKRNNNNQIRKNKKPNTSSKLPFDPKQLTQNNEVIDNTNSDTSSSINQSPLTSIKSSSSCSTCTTSTPNSDSSLSSTASSQLQSDVQENEFLTDDIINNKLDKIDKIENILSDTPMTPKSIIKNINNEQEQTEIHQMNEVDVIGKSIEIPNNKIQIKEENDNDDINNEHDYDNMNAENHENDNKNILIKNQNNNKLMHKIVQLVSDLNLHSIPSNMNSEPSNNNQYKSNNTNLNKANVSNNAELDSKIPGEIMSKVIENDHSKTINNDIHSEILIINKKTDNIMTNNNEIVEIDHIDQNENNAEEIVDVFDISDHSDVDLNDSPKPIIGTLDIIQLDNINDIDQVSQSQLDDIPNKIELMTNKMTEEVKDDISQENPSKKELEEVVSLNVLYQYNPLNFTKVNRNLSNDINIFTETYNNKYSDIQQIKSHNNDALQHLNDIRCILNQWKLPLRDA